MIKLYGRKLDVYENGEIWRHPFTDSRGRTTKPRWAVFTRHRQGYLTLRVGHRMLKAHRLVAMAFLEGLSDDLQVDHINGVKDFNHRLNLRVVCGGQNSRGFLPPKEGTSKYRGVSRYRGRKWMAGIRKDYKNYHIGYFQCEKEAAKAYDKKATELGFAKEALNFPNHEY